MSKHPIHPVFRIALPLLRWPIVLSPALMWIGDISSARYAAPLQKQFYGPIFATLWAVLALLPFVLIRGRVAFRIYCVAFLIIGGWLLYDLLVPFRYIAPDFHGTIEDPGGSYTIQGSRAMGYDYWITRFVRSSLESWLMFAFLVWPFALGSLYHFLYVRGRCNDLTSR